MALDIACHHTTLTDGLREAVEQKLARVQSHASETMEGRVVLTVEPHRHLAEATVRVGKLRAHARAEAPSMYSAIDKLAARLDRAIRKHKVHMARTAQPGALSVRDLPTF